MSTSHSRRDSDRALQLDASPPRGRGMWAEMQHLLGDAFGGSSPASEAAEREGGLDFARQGPSPMGADSPVTIFQGSRSQSPVDRRERDRGLPASGADADASALLQLLEQLDGAITAWEKSIKSHTSLMGDFQIDPAHRHAEQAVDVASLAFEQFRAKLAKALGQQLLKTLERFSPWDALRVQELLERRAAYFLRDPEKCRFACAEAFLQLVPERRRWPEAEPLAMRWPQNLERLLGTAQEDWRVRARQLKQAPTTATGVRTQPHWWNALLNVGSNELASSDPELTGTLVFTKIRARNLRSADRFDESDPFVKFDLGGVARPAITTVVWNNERNPEWKDPQTGVWEEVVMNINRAPLSDMPKLHISVWDKNTFSSNDSLGSHGLPLVQLLRQHGNLSQKIGFVTGPLPLTGHGAGDKSPHVEMEVIWTPEEVAKRGPEDPLLLAPEKDRPLQLLAGMAATLPGFADAFSSASMGFFLQQEDNQRMELGKRPDSSSAEKVKAYNQILNRIKNLLWASPVDYTELGYLLDKAKDLERRAGQGELRRIVAFQDECLPDIGEWSTDRRRQLRNQVFLAKLDDHGKVGNIAEVLEHDLSILLAPFFLLVAAAFSCYNMWLLMNSPERAGRCWIIILSSLAGFICLVAAVTASVPKWKRFFDKPRAGVNSYQTLDA